MAGATRSETILLERDVELARLSALMDEATAGRGAVVAVEGPAGIGKTELLAAVRQQADEQGFRTLRARGRDGRAPAGHRAGRGFLGGRAAGRGGRERARARRPRGRRELPAPRPPSSRRSC